MRVCMRGGLGAGGSMALQVPDTAVGIAWHELT